MNGSPGSVRARRALEALRAGVPNRDAVVELGSMQVGAEDRFAEILEYVGKGTNSDLSVPAGLVTSPGRVARRGVMLGGGFGTGKSHLLEHLANVALSQGFVVSKVTISKETPLHDPSKVFRAAIDEARVPGRHGSAIDEIAIAVNLNSEGYRQLYRWAHQDAAPVSPQFAATLFLYEYDGDEEFRDRVTRFWAGDKLSVPDIRRRLREHGVATSYKIATIREADLSRQRFRFVSRLARAAGHRGWIILFDEVELIGRYTIGQRAKSYVEVGRWMKGEREDPDAPIGAVMATVDDYETQILNEKNDPVVIPARFRALGSESGDVDASLAELGMRIIGHELLRLQPPAQDELDRTYARLKEIHGEAFGWEPPDVPGLERLPSNRMRQYVRTWINEWDLVRLDPSYVPEIEAGAIEVDLSEDAALEQGVAEGDADDDGRGDQMPGDGETTWSPS